MSSAEMRKAGGAGVVTEDDGPPAEAGWTAADIDGLARQKAVDNLGDALVSRGVSPLAAAALARAAVRPDDLRRRLAAPVDLRVPGGTMTGVETAVWAAGIVPYPTNLREVGQRVYPLDLPEPTPGEIPLENIGLIEEPRATPDVPAELTLRVTSPRHLASRLRAAEEWLGQRNPLADDISAEGVLQPVTLVLMTVEHGDAHPPVAIVAAADGSSRTTATHQILNYDPADLVYELGADTRAYRQEIGRLLRLLHERDWGQLTEAEQRRVRALTLPARIIVGYRPDPDRTVSFDGAVQALIGLMHINPPLAYGKDVERDAMADVVLAELRRPLLTRPPRITEDERRWYAALMLPSERDAAGLPRYGDVRAADITRAILHGGNATAGRVNRGIRALTARRSPEPQDRVDVAVELILRPWRTTHLNERPTEVQARRAALQRCYDLPEIRTQPDEPLLEGVPGAAYFLDDLRDQALGEVEQGHGANGRLGSGQVELGTKAAYYMILASPMALRREPVGRLEDRDGPKDNRAPSTVLRAMMSTTRGVWQAYAIILAGRAGEPLFEVDEEGSPTRAADGGDRVLTDELVRATYSPVRRPTRQRQEESGPAALPPRWQAILNALVYLENTVEAMRAVRSAAGGSQVEEQGWDETIIGEARKRVDVVDRTLGAWGDRWSELARDRAEDGEP